MIAPALPAAAAALAAQLPPGTFTSEEAGDLARHGQGGRADLATDEAAPQRFTLKMRHVVWPSGPNRPSLVLLTPEDSKRAIACSGADPSARIVGINIGSFQASCPLDEPAQRAAERPAARPAA